MVKLRFRLINTRDEVYLLVPEHHALYLEHLYDTTYKECELTRAEIKRMTRIKDVAELDKKHWERSIGKVYFPPTHYDDSGLIHTAVKALSEREKKTQEFVNNVLGGVIGKVTYNVDRKVETGARSTDGGRNRRNVVNGLNRPELVRRNVNSDDNDKQLVPSGLPSALPIPRIDPSQNIVKSRREHEGYNRVVARVIDATEGVSTVEQVNRKRSIFVDVGKGVSQVLLYLGGTHAVNVMYMAMKKVDRLATMVTNPKDYLSKFKDIFFSNPANSVVETVRFSEWYLDISKQQQKLQELLDDANQNEEIKEIARKLWNQNTSEFVRKMKSEVSAEGEDNWRKVLLVGKDVEQLVLELYESKTEPGQTQKRNPMEMQYAIDKLRMKSEFDRYFQYVKGGGEYSQNYYLDTKEVDGGDVPVLMNYPKLIQRYDNELWLGRDLFDDFYNINRMVIKYMNQSWKPFVSWIGSDFLDTVAEVRDDIVVNESREFRRSMYSALSMYVLFLTPTITSAAFLTVDTFSYMADPRIRRRVHGDNWADFFRSTTNGITRVADLFVMSNVMITAHMQLVLLSEGMNDQYYHTDRFFGQTSINTYYFMSLVQLLYSSQFRRLMNGSGTDSRESRLNMEVIAFSALGMLAALDSAPDPDSVDWTGQLFRSIPIVSATMALWSFLSFTRRLLRG